MNTSGKESFLNKSRKESMANGSRKLTIDRQTEDFVLNSMRGSAAIDMIIPSTDEHKMYLAGIEEEESEDQSIKQ